ncbi:supervillin isoform X3 [Oryzias melastigma]|uniref:supervillin isoform X3 n=1 Tax=Oryzias melastigma TaxID=30732 RepID=UPI000CF80043|nr:supervillin isoform X3 [Oryzias melastigma]
MDPMEDAVLEPRAERIARYKAERRRELAERFNNLDDLPTKWVRRNGQEAPESEPEMMNSDGLGDKADSRGQEVTNGVETDAPAESNNLRGQGNQQDPATPLSGHSAPQLHTRVSVGQLRSALLQQTDGGAQPDRASVDGGRAVSSLDLATTPGAEGGRRRTQRYLPGGTSGSRKTNERFRTQPITAIEVEQSSGFLDVETKDNKEAEEQTDDRAKMSVAAKMSLFKEMEKSAAPETSVLLKPRSSSSSHERRARRSSDHRFLTQPITCEEMVAISTSPPADAQTDSVDDGDESCKMSMSEKLALFNKLALPGKLGAGPADGPPERRRQKGARYRTQPITVEEVSMLQKGPVQLPAFSLSAHLSDRQQVSSVNLKPSEVRLSQPRPGLTESQSSAADPCLKGILKKSRSAGSEWSRTDQNGGGGGDADMLGRMEGTERREGSAPSQRRKREGVELGSAAPWRQRVRTRRETIACTPMRGSPCGSQEQEETGSPAGLGLEQTRGAQEVEEKMDEEETSKRSVQVILSDNTNNEASQSQEARGVESWEPVFASVYSVVSPQYIMCFNQTNLSFEAQEVSSPLPAQPQWRQKAKEQDVTLHTVEAAEPETQQEAEDDLGVAASETRDEAFPAEAGTCTASRSDSLTETPRNEEASAGEPAASDGSFSVDKSLPPTCGPTPCGGIGATESEQDLGVLCQSSTPILSSAVAEHRRAVRPSRRTQGSRNPLRALAARQDVRQDFMGSAAAEEQDQAEKKSKNHSSEDPVTPEDIVSPSEAPLSFPPFSSRMLIHIKGRRHVQVRLVEPSVRSLNSGDCFLLVTPQHCILWSGEFANKQERAKGSELASFIQSRRDLGCEASHVVHLEEGLNSDSSEADDFWSLLGGRTNYRGAGVSEEDELFELGVVESNCVYSLVEDRLVPHEEAWASIPNTSLLRSTEAIVFDFGSEVYLWHGRDVSPSRRDIALQLTQQVWGGEYDYSNCRVNPLDPTRCNPSIHLKGASRPSWALLAVVAEGEETALFKEKFVDSRAQEDDPAGAETPLNLTSPEPASSGVLCPCDAKALVSGESLEAGGSVCTLLEGLDVQRGCGVITLEEGHQMELKTVAVDTWHVQEFDDSEIPVESGGQLHEGDSYVVRWTYSVTAVDNGSDESEEASGSKEKTAFFLWRGRHSRVSGRDTAAFLSIGLKNHEESQVVVPQGEEPPCFLQLFQGGLVIHKGKREETSTNAEWRLFCVRGELPQEGSLLEVDCSCTSLRSRGSAVLLNSQQGELYLWIGCKAHSNTREVSKRTVEQLTKTCPPELGLHKSSHINVHLVEEGSEPADFWAALGPMDRKAYDCMLQDPGKYNFTPRLFHLTTSSGRFQAKELLSRSRLPGLVMAMPFNQESLYSVPQPALFLLDNRLEVYLWQRGQPEQTESSASAWSLWHNERKCAMQTALQYCKEMNPRRPPYAYLILEGLEPLTFTNVFPRWERSFGPQTQGDVGQVKLTLVQDALAQLMKTQYPLEELMKSPLPEGVDPQQLEVYLSDQDFQTILEMKRDEYASLPSWKQTDLKKSKGLFC